jgi:hypothetical protein
LEPRILLKGFWGFRSFLLISIAAIEFSEISFSPLHLKGHYEFFDGHATPAPVSFAPTLTPEAVKKFPKSPPPCPSPVKGEGISYSFQLVYPSPAGLILAHT